MSVLTDNIIKIKNILNQNYTDSGNEEYYAIEDIFKLLNNTYIGKCDATFEDFEKASIECLKNISDHQKQPLNNP